MGARITDLGWDAARVSRLVNTPSRGFTRDRNGGVSADIFDGRSKSVYVASHLLPRTVLDRSSYRGRRRDAQLLSIFADLDTHNQHARRHMQLRRTS